MLKLVFVLAAVFGSTFVIARSLGWLTIENVQAAFAAGHAVHPALMSALVFVSLFADLVVSVPTLTITLLSGYYLGFPLGALPPLAGLYAAGFAGYGLSRRYGDRVFRRVMTRPEERADAVKAFGIYGTAMIMLGRAAPMLPEISACLAGLTGMPVRRFALAWTIGTLPYILIASYAGSLSTLENPAPALWTALALTGVLWIGWWVYRRNNGDDHP